ncbi:MAG TPA: SRPBCC family protein [Gemmatimonadaceae bacterium]|nr:SRPBCC family protein [Gemmatimonadaceae bacterium]
MTDAHTSMRDPVRLPAMPAGCSMRVVDERVVKASVRTMFALAREVDRWPEHLAHYRWVRFDERDREGGGLVAMSASRPFGRMAWPTWWTSEMAIDDTRPAIRFRHVRGITRGMEVEWTFIEQKDRVLARIVHCWNGPGWPLIGVAVARRIIGPVFIHGIASRTLAGLAAVAERR